MSKEKRLTWKYFCEQKIKEIARFIGWVILVLAGLFVLSLVLYSLGKLTYHIVGETCYHECEGEYILTGVGALFALSISGLFLWFVFYELLFKEWIVPNWERAKERAKEEVKERKK